MLLKSITQNLNPFLKVWQAPLWVLVVGRHLPADMEEVCLGILWCEGHEDGLLHSSQMLPFGTWGGDIRTDSGNMAIINYTVEGVSESKGWPWCVSHCLPLLSVSASWLSLILQTSSYGFQVCLPCILLPLELLRVVFVACNQEALQVK